MADYITIDGGTTNTRIALVSGHRIVDVLKFPVGAQKSIGNQALLRTTIRDGIAILLTRTGRQPGDIVRILASGMITSEFGLLELPHIAAPAGLRELHDAMYETTLPDISPIPFVFIRGVVTGGSDYADTDMMRGEETELMGLQHDGAGVYVLPGSHSKIVQTDEHGRITSFRTMLTGEMIAALSAHTILKDAVVLNAQPADRDFLLEGFRYAREHGLNDALFKVRILKNRMRRTPAEVTGFYLGAVLCDEICCILNQHPAQIILAGKKELREPMQTLLEVHVPGIVVSVPDDIAGCASALGAVRIFEYQP